ncbi:MAG: Tetraacyldisaccharide 4'-kinase [Candidatus Anoxychlamydiales bacterium]|nr:Tetraacyldisaccharide 4'-kinase [Candidatus Anoxychlamydiales bacterium]
MSLKSNFFLFIKKIIEEDKKGFFIFFIKIFLYFLSIFYKIAINFRNFLYDKNILKSKKLKPFIISIGNIVAGGSGKTPFTIFLANQIKNKKTAIVTRGYKSKLKTKSYLTKKNDTAKLIGDEAVLIKKNTDANLYIGNNKILSCKNAMNNKNDIIILDDGFQSRYLKKDLEIVLINPKDVFKKKCFLPRGLFRESIKSLIRADIVVINNLKSESDFEILKKEISKYTNAKIYYSIYENLGFYDINDQKIEFKSNKIASFSSIANPKAFFDTLEALNLEIVYKKEKLDHEKFLKNEIDEFVLNALKLGADYIIATEKDIIKLNKSERHNLPIIYLKIKNKLSDNNFNINDILDNI